jgi:hypothetical protein
MCDFTHSETLKAIQKYKKEQSYFDDGISKLEKLNLELDERLKNNSNDELVVKNKKVLELLEEFKASKDETLEILRRLVEIEMENEMRMEEASSLSDMLQKLEQ